MRFTIERRPLTDASGRPVAGGGSEVTFHDWEAISAEEAVIAFAALDGAEVIGSILKFPGFHAVATARSGTGVYTLQVSPATQTKGPYGVARS